VKTTALKEKKYENFIRNSMTTVARYITKNHRLKRKKYQNFIRKF